MLARMGVCDVGRYRKIALTGQIHRASLGNSTTKLMHKVLGYMPDGRLLANTDTNWMVWLRDAATLELQFSLPAAQFAFHPNGRYLATTSELTVDSGEWQVQIWDLNSFAHLRTFAQIGQSIAFSPDGHLLVIQGATLSEWDVETGQMVRLLPGMWPIGSISPSGLLMTSTYQGDSPEATIVDLVTGQLLHEMTGIYKLVFSPVGRFIAGSGNGTVRLWRIPDGTP